MPSEINIHELARMIRSKRNNRGLRTVAKEIGEISASTLSRIEQGKVPDLDTFIILCKWLGVSADHFTNDLSGITSNGNAHTPDVVVAHLRADRTLDPQTAEALVTMIQMAYSAVDRGEIGNQKGNHASRIQDMG
jgi:transcriptional regulator with XRE-family HTH domain